VHFIRYLDAGNYIGVDIDQSLLDAGFEVELQAVRLQDKFPRQNLVCMKDFEFEQLGCSVDFAIAQSVFTHLTFNRIRRCLERLASVTRIGGHFFATFFELPRDANASLSYIHNPGQIVTYDTSDPYHYKLADLFFAASGLPWEVRYIGDWHDPRGQHMVELVRRGITAKPNSAANHRTIEQPSTPTPPANEAVTSGMAVTAAGHPLMCAMRDMLTDYWKTNEAVPNYHYFHFLFECAITLHAELRQAWEAAPLLLSGERGFPRLLQTALNVGLSEETFQQICRRTPVHKLSWKLPQAGLADAKKLPEFVSRSRLIGDNEKRRAPAE